MIDRYDWRCSRLDRVQHAGPAQSRVAAVGSIDHHDRGSAVTFVLHNGRGWWSCSRTIGDSTDSSRGRSGSRNRSRSQTNRIVPAPSIGALRPLLDSAVCNIALRCHCCRPNEMLVSSFSTSRSVIVVESVGRVNCVRVCA